ncbi:hypothetical protein HK104_005014, partial [Borealophlyctis nickersoniae]
MSSTPPEQDGAPSMGDVNNPVEKKRTGPTKRLGTNPGAIIKIRRKLDLDSEEGGSSGEYEEEVR